MVNVWTYWKCTYCLSINRGDNRKCQCCGCSIPIGIKYLMPDNPEVVEAVKNGTVFIKPNLPVTEVEVVVPENEVNNEPNWICEHCGSQNKCDIKTCESCGASKKQAKEDYFGRSLPSNKDNENENNTCTLVIEETDKDDRTLIVAEKLSNENIDTLSVKNMVNKELSLTENKNIKNDFYNDKVIKEELGLSNEHPSKNKTPVFENIVKKTKNLIKKTKNLMNNNKTTVVVVILIIFIMFLIAIFTWLFIPVKKTGTVISFEWKRSINVEEYKLCHENGWSLPSKAHLISKKKEIDHYDDVIDHYDKKTVDVTERVIDHYETTYKDKGNGQATKEKKPVYKTVHRKVTKEEPVYVKVPIYKTRYYYTIGRWKKVDSLNASGTDKKPYWPINDLPTSISNPKYGDRKQKSKSEEYFAYVNDYKKNKVKVEFDYDEWTKLSVNSTVTYNSFKFSDSAIGKGHLKYLKGD